MLRSKYKSYEDILLKVNRSNCNSIAHRLNEQRNDQIDRSKEITVRIYSNRKIDFLH